MAQETQLDDLFMEVSELAGAEKQEFLATVKRDQPHLIGPLIDLLRRYETFDQSFDHSQDLLTEELPRQTVALADYDLLETIGEGGMGTVYLAQQKKPKRKVALKLIRGDRASTQFLQRMHSEYKVLARLNHTHIARLYEVGAADDGDPFFTMEYVDGDPITLYCQEKQLDLEARLRLFIQVCDGMSHAHQRAVIHRDLKPANILVKEEGGQPLAKIIDFGIARELPGGSVEIGHFTRTGAVIGTPAYMSPEQLDGSSDVDMRGDVFSLGRVLYEMLTDLEIFDTEQITGKSFLEIMQLYRHQEPLKPSQRVRQATGDKSRARKLQGDLDLITFKAMASEPDQRYPSIFDLKHDILCYLENRAITARAPSLIYRTRKMVRRHKVSVAAGAFALLALITALGIATNAAFSEQRAHRQTQVALQKFQTVSDFLTNMLVASDPRQGGRNTTIVEVLDEAEEALEQQDLSNDPLLQANIRHTLGQTWFGIGRYAMAEKHLREARRLRAIALGLDHEETLITGYHLAQTLLYRGNYQGAQKLFQKVLRGQQKSLGHQHQATLHTQAGLARCFINLNDFAKAETLFREVFQQQATHLGETHPHTVKSLAGLAAAIYHQRNYKEAESWLRKAFRLQSNQPGPEHPNTLSTQNNLAHCLLALGKMDEAESLYRRTWTLRKKVLGEEHPSTINTLFGLGRCLHAQKRMDEAVATLAQVVDVRMRDESPCTDKTLRAASLLATVHGDAGHPKKAITVLQAILKQVQEHHCPPKGLTLRAMSNMGHYLVLLGSIKEAEEVLTEALRLAPQAGGGQEKRVLNLTLNLGEVYQKQGLADKALASFVDGFHQATALYPKDPLGNGYVPIILKAMAPINRSRALALLANQERIAGNGENMAPLLQLREKIEQR